MALSYLALGDSYTIGEAVAVEGRWPHQLAAALRAQDVALADPQTIATTGWTTDELDAGIDAAAPEGPYGLVSLLIGVNDQYRGRGADAYLAPFGVLADVIPFVGSIVRMGTGLIAFALALLVGSATIAVAWFWYRPLLAAGIAIAGLAVAYVLMRIGKRRAAAAPQAGAAA